MMQLKDVVFKYHYDDFAIFKGLSFTLHAGVNTILCDVQNGKSTLCKLLCGQIRPQSGNITLDGISIYENADNGILYLPKTPTFFENKSVLYNVAYPLKVRNAEKSQRTQIATMLAQKFDLPLDVKVKNLTKTQRLQLALARGLTVKRKVVLFDDFFDDATNLQQTLDLFDAQVKVVLTSNADTSIGNTIVIDDGKCAFCGDKAQAQQIYLSKE